MKCCVLHILFVLERQISCTGNIKHDHFMAMGLIQCLLKSEENSGGYWGRPFEVRENVLNVCLLQFIVLICSISFQPPRWPDGWGPHNRCRHQCR